LAIIEGDDLTGTHTLIAEEICYRYLPVLQERISSAIGTTIPL